MSLCVCMLMCNTYCCYIAMMWDSLLYAMNMFYYHWLIKKAALPYGRAEYSKAGKTKLNAGKKKAEPGKCYVVTQEAKGNKPQAS